MISFLAKLLPYITPARIAILVVGAFLVLGQVYITNLRASNKEMQAQVQQMTQEIRQKEQRHSSIVLGLTTKNKLNKEAMEHEVSYKAVIEGQRENRPVSTVHRDALIRLREYEARRLRDTP